MSTEEEKKASLTDLRNARAGALRSWKAQSEKLKGYFDKPDKATLYDVETILDLCNTATIKYDELTTKILILVGDENSADFEAESLKNIEIQSNNASLVVRAKQFRDLKRAKELKEEEASKIAKMHPKFQFKNHQS